MNALKRTAMYFLGILLSFFLLCPPAPAGEDTERMDARDTERMDARDGEDEKAVEETVEVTVEQAMRHVEEQMKKVEASMERLGPEMEKLARSGLDLDLDLDIDIPEPPEPPSPPDLSHMNRDFRGEIERKSSQHDFAVRPDESLRIRSEMGYVFIRRATEENTLRATIEVTAGANTAALAKELLDAIRVRAERTGDGVEIEIKPDAGDVQSNQTMFYAKAFLTVPDGLRIEVENGFGDLILEGAKGEFNTQNSFGSTRYIGCEGPLTATSSHGAMTIERHRGGGMLESKFGRLRIDSITASQLDVNAQHGHTEIHLLSDDVKLNGEFSFGPTKIRIPRTFGGTIRAVSKFGPIHAPESLREKKDMFNTTVEGSLGEGGGSLTLTSQHGPLFIRWADEDGNGGE